MTIAAGIDVGSSAVKVVVLESKNEAHELLARSVRKIRRRDVADVVEEAYADARQQAGVERIDYLATTGEGEDIDYATGHFYGMTTHARGGLFLDGEACAVLDLGALHARAVAMDGRGRVLGYKMTSQCASGSGQFLENISRYLGVTQAEIGALSLEADEPEKISSICAVLAETDVINMVSRGISTENILRGIHESMAGRFAQLLRGLKIEGKVVVTGGLAADTGLIAAMEDDLNRERRGKTYDIQLVTHPQSVYAGALGAAIWGGIRHDKVGGVAWTA